MYDEQSDGLAERRANPLQVGAALTDSDFDYVLPCFRTYRILLLSRGLSDVSVVAISHSALTLLSTPTMGEATLSKESSCFPNCASYRSSYFLISVPSHPSPVGAGPRNHPIRPQRPSRTQRQHPLVAHHRGFLHRGIGRVRERGLSDSVE